MLFNAHLLTALSLLTLSNAGHMAQNTSDVITTYMGHSDVQPVFRKGNEKGGRSAGERKGDKLKSEEKENDSDYLEQTNHKDSSDVQRHMAHTTSDVITTYMGHSDVQAPVQPFRKGNKKGERGGKGRGDKLKTEEKKNDEDFLEQTTAHPETGNDVVFIPSGNNDPSFRRSGGARRDEYSVKDMMERVAVGDVINERYRTETEAPAEGAVVFKPGKNDERTEEKIKHEMDDERIEQAVKEYKEIYENPMDCENLDCENVLEAVCGVKLENKRPKYRLFKNECFFRKVNCGLKYDYNRYRTVSIDQCDGVGSHLPPQEHTGWIQYQPRPLPRSQPSGGQTSGRRTNSRRAMTANADGLPCNHYCPTRCPDMYTPVCAYTSNRARVFQNHCQLDLQSCSDGSVWQERALAECAGDVRAEVHERAAFISWMQRMGILDKKGHLVM
ncbi:uncharacterized protein LOC125239491 [Leguminivora glycinivorella]|uniref:uncharacterized protein LOC125239491 n=1 Tax=Leguminivora glycinivorella TaxID=1035111 RepID=UPI00200F8D60|nr:uncharacterized protein LOC125239491 [Leguminivora glycinivorella]